MKPITLPSDSRWTVIGPLQMKRVGARLLPYVLAKCSCGSDPRLVVVYKLTSGSSKSCGCQAKANHRAFCQQWKKLAKRPQRTQHPRHEAGHQGPAHEAHSAQTQDAARANRKARKKIDAQENSAGAQAEEARST